jgi:hypothetical protein
MNNFDLDKNNVFLTPVKNRKENTVDAPKKKKIIFYTPNKKINCNDNSLLLAPRKNTTIFHTPTKKTNCEDNSLLLAPKKKIKNIRNNNTYHQF